MLFTFYFWGLSFSLCHQDPRDVKYLGYLLGGSGFRSPLFDLLLSPKLNSIFKPQLLLQNGTISALAQPVISVCPSTRF